MAWAIPRGEAPGLAGNPAADVPQLKRPRGAPIAHRAWTDAEVATVLEAASPALRLPLAAAPGNGFQRMFFKLIRRLEELAAAGKGLTFHGLRHTVGKRLADAGCDTRDIQAWLEHRTTAMADHYAKEADQRLRVKGAVAKLDRAARHALPPRTG